MAISITAPFNLAGGSIASTSDVVANAEQKILNVLVTGKYERAGRAQYGAGLQQLLFENVEELEFTDWKTDASTEISQNVAGIRIIDIRTTITDDTTATVTVYYSFPMSSPRAVTYVIPINTVLTEESPI